jgi:hypothetical protein
MIQQISDPSAPSLLRTRTLDAAGAIVAIFWASLAEDLQRVAEYHRELLQTLASRFHALQQSTRLSTVAAKAPVVAQLLFDYNACITFAVANVRALEKLAKKLAKVVKFPLKDVIFVHFLQSQPFARACVPAAIAEHLNVLLLIAQDASVIPLRLPDPLNALIANAASCACSPFPALHFCNTLRRHHHLRRLSYANAFRTHGSTVWSHAMCVVLQPVPEARSSQVRLPKTQRQGCPGRASATQRYVVFHV